MPADNNQSMSPRLVLGTVQLGMPYGIANTTGKPDREQAHAILNAAYAEGIRFLDTAQQYGDSEALIASYLKRYPDKNFSVISKLAPDTNVFDEKELFTAIEKSARLLSPNLAGILFHDATILTKWNVDLSQIIRRHIASDTLPTLGVSIYNPEEMELALFLDDLKIIQLPANVFDRRFLQKNLLETVKKKGKVIFVRSVFLQGLLLMPYSKAIKIMPQAEPYLTAWHDLCQKYQIGPGATALQYIAAMIPGANILIGCERAEQVKEDSNWLKQSIPSAAFEEINSWPIPPLEIINPVYWKKEDNKRA